MRLWTAESGFESLRPNHADSSLRSHDRFVDAPSGEGIALPRALGWGAVWGLGLGFWLLAPTIVASHRFALASVGEWLRLDAALAALFVALGALLTLPLAAVLALFARAGRARRAPEMARALPLALPAWLAPGYLLAGELIHLVRFRQLDDPAPYLAALRAVTPPLAITLVGALAIDRGLASFARPRRRAGLAALLLLGALAGALRLPAAQPPRPVPFPAHALARADAAAPPRPLVVLGIDGGDWQALRPLLGTGRLPTFDALLARGVHGDVDALWPPYWSTSAWAAIVTGAPREATGVWEDLAAEAPGLPPFQAPLDLEARLLPVQAVEYLLVRAGLLRVAPPPRDALARPPVWEWLDRSGVRTAVVRFNFSYPAPGQAAIVLSNRVVPDLWNELGVRPPDPGLVVAPAARREELLRLFAPDAAAERRELARVLPAGAPRPRDVEIDPGDVVARVLPFDLRTFDAVAHLLATERDLGVVVAHLGGFDNVCHAFWPYRFPEQFRRRPPEEEIAALGPVVDRYLEMLDRGLARVLAAAPATPNVLVVSDHGETALEDGVPWRGWHGSPGIFLAAGPDVARRPEALAVSYFDVAPTVLALAGLAPPPQMSGRVLARAGGAVARAD